PAITAATRTPATGNQLICSIGDLIRPPANRGNVCISCRTHRGTARYDQSCGLRASPAVPLRRHCFLMVLPAPATPAAVSSARPGDGLLRRAAFPAARVHRRDALPAYAGYGSPG